MVSALLAHLGTVILTKWAFSMVSKGGGVRRRSERQLNFFFYCSLENFRVQGCLCSVTP